MLLSKPLEDLVSPEKASILLVLERTGQPLTGRTIAKLTGTVSQPTTSRLLADLVRRGLVTKVPGGYELNRDHLAYRALEVLLGARDELVRRVADNVTRWHAPPLSVVLFGSVARREENLDSDLDLLVVRPASVPFDDARWAANVANLAERVTRWCGLPCEILEYAPRELHKLRRNKDPLIDALLTEGVTLAGTDLDNVLRGRR